MSGSLSTRFGHQITCARAGCTAWPTIAVNAGTPGQRSTCGNHGLGSEDMARVDSAYFEEIAGRLRGLLIRLSDRLSDKDLVLIAEFIDANELGLALEQMADALSEDKQPLSPDERAEMLALVEQMHMGGRVPRALSFCPAHD